MTLATLAQIRNGIETRYALIAILRNEIAALETELTALTPLDAPDWESGGESLADTVVLKETPPELWDV